MQRPRRPNRQSRRGDSNISNSNSNHPSANSSRGGSSRPPRPRAEYTSVPSFSSIAVGGGVSIILKQDQSTGRQVRGIVAEHLTRGDHPRGVKVRLRDGRVGRAQGLVSEEEGKQGEDAAGGADANLGRDGVSDGYQSRRGRGGGSGGRGFRHVADIRDEDEYLWDESRGTNLGEYFSNIDLDGRVNRGRAARDDATLKGAIEMVKCPVCGEFEGDEQAVAHHVEKHFEDE